MKLMKRTSFIIMFLLSLVCVANYFNNLLIDDTRDYTRLTIHDMYNEQNNIDTLFLGSSHVYRSFDTRITDNMLGQNTFNLGTSSQDLLGSYILLKETLKTNKVKNVYLDMYYYFPFLNNYNERSEFTDVYIIADYLKFSFNKIYLLLNSTPQEYYINNFFPARRNWEKIYDKDYIKNLKIAKQSETYKSYKWTKLDGDTDYYIQKGFVTSERVLDTNKYVVHSWRFDMSKINSDWTKYLNKIIELCKKRGINLTLIMAPVTEQNLYTIDNYDDYYNYLNDIASRNNIEYWDFNLLKNEYFDTLDNTLYLDADHLNGNGAELFSVLFCRYVNGEVTNDKLFFKSFADKISNKKPAVYGISQIKNSQNNLWKIVSSGNDVEYEILLKREGVTSVIRQYSVNKEFEYEPIKNDIIVIKTNNKILDNVEIKIGG